MSLERVANLVLIVTCLAVAGQVTWRYAARPSPPRAVKAGDYITDTSALGLRQHRRTLILFTASTCHFCKESIPFYQRLGASAQAARVRLIAASAEPIAKNEEFLRASSVRVDSVVSSYQNRLPSQPTPTLLLVAGDGRVMRSWLGRLTGDQEGAVLRALSAM